MNHDELRDFYTLKQRLDAHQPWLLGVSITLAAKLGCRTWAVRLVAILALILLTGPTLVVYLLLGLVLDETRATTLRWIRSLAVFLGKTLGNLASLVRKLMEARHARPTR